MGGWATAQRVGIEADRYLISINRTYFHIDLLPWSLVCCLLLVGVVVVVVWFCCMLLVLAESCCFIGEEETN